MTLFINYDNLKADEGLFNIIKQVSGIEWFDYAIFNASNDAFMIRLTNNTFEHSYKVVKYNNGLKINNHPIWIKVGKYDRAVVNKERVLMDGEDVLIQFSLTDEDFSPDFKLLKKYAFGVKIKNKIIIQKMKEIKGGVDFFRECAIKYNDFVEVLYSKSMVFECLDGAVFNKGFKFVIIDVLNSQLLVKKWNGRVFNKGGNLMVNPDVFLNLFKTGRIIDYRKVFKE
jgi:hypothetical protein